MKRIVVFALVLNAALLGVIAHQLVAIAGGEAVATENGDNNGDGSRDLSDAIYMLQWLFGGGPGPVEIESCGEQNARLEELERQLDECRGAGGGEPCPSLRVRKEITSMQPGERARFISTYLEAWNSPDGELQELANSYTTFFSRGLHNNGAFLPWHRGYLLRVENILQSYEPGVTIPYWDWTRQPQINESPIWGSNDDQFSSNGDAQRCVQDGPFGFNTGFALTNGRCLERRITGGSAASPAEVDNLYARFPLASNFDAFRNRLEHGPGLNDSVHCIVGGTMCSARASNDPIFFLHHAQVDRIWAQWQSTSPVHLDAYVGITGRDELLPGLPFTPGELLDPGNLPGGVQVIYE
jgi:tyrosinase